MDNQSHYGQSFHPFSLVYRLFKAYRLECESPDV